MDELSKIKNLSKEAKYYEDLYEIIWKINLNKKIKKQDYNGIKIGLINTPCAGFGDIIVCKTFYDYLNDWYPDAKVSICTTTPMKYKDLGVDGNIYKLYNKNDNSDSECIDYDKLVLKKKITFDIMIIIPIINKTFEINVFKKMIPYANIFNTFTVSEYNGEYPPYTFPIGVGKGQLGLLMNNFKYKKQSLIKSPYALVYIQPSPEWGVHSKYCFVAYLEMICKNYKKYKRFQIIIPEWIEQDLNGDDTFYRKSMNVLKKYYGNVSIIYPDKTEDYFIENADKDSQLTFRADILPQKREIFISLMKDSVEDILVTGDQSLTDIFSCCKDNKRVWYQIAPWKKGLSFNLSKELPNKYYSTFKTSCGTMRAIDTKIDWGKFMKNYDFRIVGKQRMDSVIMGVNDLKKSTNLQRLLDVIEHSRYLETVKQKIDKLK